MPPPAITELDVYLGDRLVGKLTRPGSGRLAFRYTDEVVASAPGEILLSVSLPVQQERFPNGQTRPFFEGLLPEGAIREQVARELGVSSDNAFSLLGEIGAECAGAVVIVPAGQEPAPATATSVRWLTEEELVEALANLPIRPLGVGADVRLSLGGLQKKLVVTRNAAGRIGQPLGGAPSTHIIKPSLTGYEDVATNEAFCLHIAQCSGIPAAQAQLEMIGETSILMVTRFDRTLTDELRIERLHQEDFCQALGVLPERKYEFEDGPSVVKVVEIIRNVSSRPAADLNTFVRAVALHFLLGNSDAHGKNFALLYHRDSGPQLAPLYDIVCTDVYDLNTNLAMYIGGEENPDRVDVNAWRGLAEECGLNATLLIQDLQALAERVLKCADAVSRTAAAEGWRRPIIDAILATITRRAAQIQELSLTR